MKFLAWCMVGVFTLAGCDGSNWFDKPQVPKGELPGTARYDLPVILTGRNLPALEARMAGVLVRRGPCLHLDVSPEGAVIVWDQGTTIDLADERGLAIVLPSGLRVFEGDMLRGGGGNLPPGQPISDFTNEDVPEECATGDAVQFHSVEVLQTAPTDEPAGRAPPPPPPPLAPSFLDSVKGRDNDSGRVVEVIRGVDDPREALLVHVLSSIRDEQGHRNAPACLREVDIGLFDRLSRRFDELYRAGECRWSDGGVVLRRDDRGAAFVSANLDCNGRNRCVAEGARVYGNVGGEGQGYILRPVAGGWEIRTAGVSWMS